MLQIHHLDPNDYTNLDPNKFVVLCSSDHDLVERISKKILSKNTKLLHKGLWLLLLERFLPYVAKEKLQEELLDT